MKIISFLFLLLICFNFSKAQYNETYYESYEYRHTISEKTYYASKHINCEIHCLQGKSEECEVYKEQLEYVFNEFENLIDFKNDITFSIYFLDLKYVCKKCLSMALPPNYIFLRELNSNQVFSYPQALVKQLIVNDNDYNVAYTDFTIAINVDQDIEDIKTIGKFALAREMLHGMGITLTGDLVNSRGYKFFSEDFYVPQIREEIELGDENVDVDVRFKKFYPLNVFEKNIVTQLNPDYYIFDSLNSIYNITFPEQEYNYMSAVNDTRIERKALSNAYTPITQSPFYEKAKEIAQLFKQKGSVGFRAYDGSVVPLQTFKGEYYRSVSVCHIDIPKITDAVFYDYDPFNKNEIKDYLNEDFIMNYTYMFMYDVGEIAKIVSKEKEPKIFGPGVIKILKTMGYSIKGDTAPLNTEYILARDIEIETDNYIDLALSLAGEHDFYGKGSRYSGAFTNKVCNVKSYLIAMFILSLFV